MSKFEAIDQLLDSYLTKYGAQIPDFDDEAFINETDVNLSQKQDIDQLKKHLNQNNAMSLNPANNDDNQYKYSKVQKFTNININKAAKALLDSKQLSDNTISTSTNSQQYPVIKQYSELLNRVPKPPKNYVKHDEALKSLLVEQIRAKSHINQQQVMEQQKIENECYNQDYVSNGKVSLREVYVMRLEITKLKSLLNCKNESIRQMQTENSKLKKQMSKKYEHNDKLTVVQRELDAVVQQVTCLKKENQRLQNLVQQFIK